MRWPVAATVWCPAVTFFVHGTLSSRPATEPVCALQKGARQGKLGNSTFERLNLGLILLATGNTLLQTTTAAKPDSVLTFPAFWATALIFGATLFVAWGGYGKNSEEGLSLKRAGPLPIAKVCKHDHEGLPHHTSSDVLFSAHSLHRKADDSEAVAAAVKPENYSARNEQMCMVCMAGHWLPTATMVCYCALEVSA